MTRVEDMTTLAQKAGWFFGFGDEYPDLFAPEYLTLYWQWYIHSGTIANHGVKDDNLLRAAILKMARISCNSCTDCDLHHHRLSGRPVFDDASYYSDPFIRHNDTKVPIGAFSAQIMVVAEGPGQFEQRTGQPFVSPLVLTGSPCAQICGEFEKCYPANSRTPQSPCKPSSLIQKLNNVEEEVARIRKERASKSWSIMTAGSLLDLVIGRAGLWREGWNDRQFSKGDVSDRAKPRSGTIYMTNIVKCRSCEENPNELGGWKDIPPTSAQAEACRRWLEIQIKVVQPRAIIALGAPAITGLLGIKSPKVLKLAGSIHKGPMDIPTVAGIHPSYALRQGEEELGLEGPILKQVLEVFEKAVRVAAGEEPLPWELPVDLMTSVNIPPAPVPSEAVYISTTPEDKK